MELKNVFDTWLKRAPDGYADRQWLLSKWEVCEGIEWPESKILAMIASISEGLRLRPHHTLADLGCGGGWIAERLRPSCRRLTGLDFCLEMLKVSAARGPGPWAAGAIGRLPFRAGSFDRALSYFVFLNFTDDRFVDEAIRDMVRVLAPGGIALIGQMPDAAASVRYDAAKQEYLDYCRRVMPVGSRNDNGTRAPLRLFDKNRLCQGLSGLPVRYEIRPSFNPFYREGQPALVDWRFDLVIFKD